MPQPHVEWQTEVRDGGAVLAEFIDQQQRTKRETYKGIRKALGQHTSDDTANDDSGDDTDDAA